MSEKNSHASRLAKFDGIKYSAALKIVRDEMACNPHETSKQIVDRLIQMVEDEEKGF